MQKDKLTILYADQAVSFGGSIIVLGSLVGALDKSKFRAVVAGEMSESILDYHMQGNARIYVIPRIFNYTHWFKVTDIASKIHSRLLKKIFIYLLSGIKTLLNTVYIFRLGRIIIKEKVDIVHVNNGMSNLEPIITAILLRRKYVVHFHGVEKPGLVQRLLINRVHKYIVISQFLADALSKNGFPRERMVIIPNPYQESHALGNDSSDIQSSHNQNTGNQRSPQTNTGLRTKYHLNPDDKVFAIVGRIVRWKGHVEFLQAAFIVLQKVPDAKALIVGDFSDGDSAYQDQIQQMIDDSGFGDRVIMTGYIKDIGSMYRIMDVCVHTSIEPEPFGLVIIEAMANSVPVIAADTGAPKEIISDGENGYIINPHSPQKIADAITQLLNDDAGRKQMGDRALQHVKKKYNDKDYARAVERIYTEVLD